MGISPKITAKYIRWIEKKSAGKPAPVVTMMRRTNATAISMLSELEDVPFRELSSSLYFICQDLQAQEFVHRYEAQLELAGANQDAFVKGLHKFFNDMARFVKDNELYPEYFEFISLCTRLRYEDKWNEKSPIRRKVIDAYMSLLMQNLEYMRPNKFDFSTVVCGLDTNGEIMVTKDLYPDIDECIRELEGILTSTSQKHATPVDLDAIVYSVFRRKYPEIRCMDDLNNAMEDDRMFTHHHSALATYLNEYNFDILPSADKVMSRNITPYMTIQAGRVDMEALEQSLSKRARALPTNGVLFEIKMGGEPVTGPFIQSVLMREVYHDDRIVMLYKYTLAGGEAAGFYDTKDNFFYSVLREASDPAPYNRLKSFILYLYAAATTRGGEQMLAEFGDKIYLGEDGQQEINPVLQLTVEPFTRGGKLYRTYGTDKEGIRNPVGPRAGSDKYEAESHNIQGFIRRVGAGRTPSREAVERAEALGYQLAPDETYVQPFVKKVFHLKKKD